MDFIISRRLSSDRLYAYCKKRFWIWDDARCVWKESHLMSQKYEREHAARAALTPEQFMTDLTKFQQLDEFELDTTMLDALKDAKPCKNAPIEPVEELHSPSAQCSDAATAAESQTAASPAAPEGSSLTTERADAVQNAAVPASAGKKNAAPSAGSGSSSGKYLTFIPESMAPKFDYSGLSDQTVADLHLAEKEYRNGKKMAARGYIRMGEAVEIAHDALVANCDKHNNQHSEDNFRKWCLSIGITKDTAYRLLQISSMFESSSPRQQDILQELPPSLLYAAAKPSAPSELVEKVKNGEVTTNKAYQDLLKENQQLRTDRVEAMNQADRERARADTAEAHLEAAQADVAGLKEQNGQLRGQVDAANAREEEAWSQREKAETRARNAENALKKQPIAAVVDEEEVDRRAHQQAYSIAADMTTELKADKDKLTKDNAALRKQLAALRAKAGDDAQADFESANFCVSLIRSAWDANKASYSRLTGEDLESTFQALCGVLNGVMEEASRLCRQPADYDGGADHEPDV